MNLLGKGEESQARMDQHKNAIGGGKAGHTPDDCRYKTAKCYNCGKLGHIKEACRVKKKKAPKAQNERQIEEDPEDEIFLGLNRLHDQTAGEENDQGDHQWRAS